LEKSNVINKPAAVKLASNKLSFFNHVKDSVRVPFFTTDFNEAKAEILDKDAIVVVREKLTGHSGEGLVILEDEEDWEMYNHSRAKLYVKYIPKFDEYRIHVNAGEVIDIQRKALRNDIDREEANWHVRSHANGFIFARNEDKKPPQDVLDQSVAAVVHCGLDFGAVDVVWNKYHGQAFVLEINTAPGLEGETVETYTRAFTNYISSDTVTTTDRTRGPNLDDLLRARDVMFSEAPEPAVQRETPFDTPPQPAQPIVRTRYRNGVPLQSDWLIIDDGF
jgi:glutathione synthase/RimK-type ligase-like ATP-grasp enzyme